MSDSVFGTLMLQCKQVTSTAAKNTDFVFPPDPYVIDDITKKPLAESQKPVIFFKSLLELHTVKGEWVLNGHSGIICMHNIIRNWN